MSPSLEILNMVLEAPTLKDVLKQDLRPREGTGVIDEQGRFEAYFDSAGIPTIGIGSRTTAVFDVTGNLRTASLEEVEADFDVNAQEAIAGAQRIIPGFDKMSETRQVAFAGMVFQMGEAGVSGFVNMIKELSKSTVNWDRVADEVLDSEFFRNAEGRGTPARAQDMADFVREG